jgi:tryptophan halogenase
MKIKDILIVGGGSSGWMTAAAIAKCLPNFNVTLVESATIPIVGVGESTLSHINEYLEILGLKDEDWMPLCDATYKTSIRFSDFNKPGEYFHDILKGTEFPVQMDGIYDFFMLTKLYPDEFNVRDFSRFFDDNHYMTDTGKFVPGCNLMNWDFKYNKAYHMDAYKFGMALKKLVADPHGCKHIVDDVVEVVTAGNDVVLGIKTKEHGVLQADLYIDCTGFRSLILGSALKVPYVSFSDVLPNDTALACNIPYEDKEVELNSYTNCTAIENGWVWNIPIWNRMGSGYCFSSKFVSPEDALVEYKNHLRKQFGKRADEIEPRLIKFVPGIRERAWVGNVVGVGLSNGFLEPLRSTGLLMTHVHVTSLVDVLSRVDGNITRVDRDGYNFVVREMMDSLKDFVSSHYSLSKRSDTPYWHRLTEEQNYFSYTECYRNFARICNRTHKAEIAQPISLKILTGSGYNPVSDIEFNRLINGNMLNTDRLSRIRSSWIKRRQILEEYTDKLPTLSQYLASTMYKDVT